MQQLPCIVFGVSRKTIFKLDSGLYLIIVTAIILAVCMHGLQHCTAIFSFHGFKFCQI